MNKFVKKYIAGIPRLQTNLIKILVIFSISFLVISPGYTADVVAPSQGNIFTLTVENFGAVDLEGVEVTASLIQNPDGLITIIGVTPNGVIIPPGGSEDFEIEFDVACPPEGSDSTETAELEFTITTTPTAPLYIDGCGIDPPFCSELQAEFTVEEKLTECEECEDFQKTTKTPEEIGLCNECDADGHIVPKDIDDDMSCTNDWCDPSDGSIHHDFPDCPPLPGCISGYDSEGCCQYDCDNLDPQYYHTNRKLDPPIEDIKTYLTPVNAQGEPQEIAFAYDIHTVTCVNIFVYDINGTIIRVIGQNVTVEVGQHQVSWDGRDEQGQLVPVGLYWLQVIDCYVSDWVYLEQEIVIDNSIPVANLLGAYLEDRDEDSVYESLVIKGTAYDENILRYYVIVTKDGIENARYDVQETSVVNSELALFTNTLFDPINGSYAIELYVEDKAGNLVGDYIEGTLELPDSYNGLEIKIISIEKVQDLGTLNTAHYPDDAYVWIDDTVPQGANDPIGNWAWDSSVKLSGARSHTDEGGQGKHYHYFIHSNEKLEPEIKHNIGGSYNAETGIGINTNIIQYVLLDPQNPPKQILIQFYTENGNGEHRAYWGQNLINMGGTNGTESCYYMGTLPPAGKWARLKISAYDLGLVGEDIRGILFATYDGKAYWDKTTTSSELEENTTGSYVLVIPGEDNKNPATIKYSLNRETNLTLQIYDNNNFLIRTLIDNELTAPGFHQAIWDNKDTSGQIMQNGTYFFQFSTSDGPIDSDAVEEYGIIVDTAILNGKSLGKLCVDSLDTIYVIDRIGDSVIRFDSSGNPLQEIPIGGTPGGLAVDSMDNLYITETTNHIVLKYDSTGVLQDTIGGYGQGDLEFDTPSDITIDASNNLYIADSGNYRIQVIDSGGGFNTSFTLVADDPLTTDIQEGPSYLPEITAMDRDSQGNFYVVDNIHHTVIKYDSSGNFIKEFGCQGNDLGELDIPADLVIDINDNIYVADSGNNRIQKFDLNGFYLAQTGIREESSGTTYFLDAPSGIGINSLGNLIIADKTNYEIESFNVARGIIELDSIVAKIIAPWEDSLIGGWVAIQGTASAQNFYKYTVDYGYGRDPDNWIPLIESYTEKDNKFYFSGHATWGAEKESYLATMDISSGWSPHTMGTLTVRLIVYTYDGRQAEDRVHVIWAGLCNRGGTITSSDYMVNLIVPSGAVPTMMFSIEPVYEARLDTGLYTPVGHYYEIRPPGTEFNKPATIEMSYPQPAYNVDENKLGIYQWDPITQDWDYLGGTIDTVNNRITIQVNALTFYESYYVIFANNGHVSVPLVYQPQSPTSNRMITIEGIAEPLSDIEIYINNQLEKIVKADGETGYFSLSGVLLAQGVNTIKARAIDVLGNISLYSNIVSVEYVPPQVITVNSLNFMTSDYNNVLGMDVHVGDTLFIELQGTNNDPVAIDTVFVIINSSIIDPIGFYVPLFETGPDSGIYRNKAFIKEASDRRAFEIGASSQGEVITIVSEDDPGITDNVVIADIIPPSAPFIISTSHPSLVQYTFENSIGGLANRSGSAGGYVSMYSTNPFAGNYSAKITNKYTGGDMGIVLIDQPYNAREYPIVSFAYNIPAGIRTNIIVGVGNTWYEVVFTDEAKHVEAFDVIQYTTIGYLSVIADGAWHEVEFNLYLLLKNLLPDQDDIMVEEIIMADWDVISWSVLGHGNSNNAGASYYLDNFIIGTPGNSNDPSFTWHVDPDPSGITGYSYTLDSVPDTMPDGISEGIDTQVTFTGIGDGTYYFHLMAQDGAGNWGPAEHYQIKVDITGPSADSPLPGDGVHSSNSEIMLHITDNGGSGVDADTILIEVENQVYGIDCGGMTYDPITETLLLQFWKIEPTPPPIVDAQEVNIILLEAFDLAGNPLQQPFSWSWTADYSTLAGGDLSLLTTGGGYSPSWSFDGTKIAFVSERDGAQNIYTIDADDYAEAGNSVIQLTNTQIGTGNYQPAWSPINDIIAFVSDRDGSPDIWAVHSDGTGLIKLTQDDPDGQYAETHPTWSPDGAQIAYTRNDTIWIMNADGTNPHAVAGDGVYYYFEPEWSRDGTKITFTKSLYTDRIWTVNVDGTGEKKIADNEPARTPSWMPDGKRILFNYNDAVWIAKTDGSIVQEFIDNRDTWRDAEPDWSLEANKLTFQSTRNGAWNIWVMSVLEVSNVEAIPSVFSPNGDGIGDSVEIRYNLSVSNVKTTLKIYNTANNSIKTLVNQEIRSQGTNYEVWDGTDDQDNTVSDGRYTFKLEAESLSGESYVEKSGTLVVDTGLPSSSASFNGNHYFSEGIHYIRQNTSVAITGNDAGAGIAQIEFSLDAGINWVTYNQAFIFPVTGSATLLHRAIDNVGNVETVNTVQIFIDEQPPSSQLVASGPLYDDGTNYYAPIHYTYSVTSFDDASGVKDKYISNTSLPTEGNNNITYYAQDNVGNIEQVRGFTLIVDNTPPECMISPSGTLFNTGTALYASLDTIYALSATDNASGVEFIEFKIDNDLNYQAYTGTISFSSSGPHIIVYRATDNVGNVGAEYTYSVIVAESLPTTALHVMGSIYWSQTEKYAPMGNIYRITSSAQSVDISIDGGVTTTYTTYPIDISIDVQGEGLHTITFEGQDEPEMQYSVILDSSAPVTTIDLGTHTYGSGPTYINPGNHIALTSQDALSGTQFIQYAINSTDNWITYSSAFTISVGGLTTIYYRSTDNVGNHEAVSSVDILLDDIAPQLNDIIPSGNLYYSGNNVYVPDSYNYTITASDMPSGLDRIEININNGGYTTYTQPFILTGGQKVVKYRAIDHVGNQSQEKTFTVYVDNQTPVSAIRVDQPKYGTNPMYVKNVTNIYVDSSDTGSGVSSVEYRLNGEADWHYYSSPIKLMTAGANTIEYRSTDHVGNTEQIKSAQFYVDMTSPQTTIQFADPHSGNQPVYINTTTTMSLHAVDGNGAGVRSIEYKIDNASWSNYNTPFSIAYPGQHYIYYRSTDRLGTQESPMMTEIYVDVIPPESSIIADDIVATDGLKNYALISTGFTIDATDNNSGIKEVYVRVNENGDFVAYSGPITFGTTGMHKIEFKSIDNVDNEEPVQTYQIEITDILPLVSIIPNGIVYKSGTSRYAPSTTNYTLTATGAATLDYIVYRIDNTGNFVIYNENMPIQLNTEGHHLIEFAAVINGQQLSSVSYEVIVDDTPPATELVFGAPIFISNNTTYITSATTVTLNSQETSSGLKHVKYSLNGGQTWQTYSNPFTLSPSGTYTIQFRGEDNVSNQEITKSVSAFVDNTSPSVNLTPSGTLITQNNTLHGPLSYFYTLSANDLHSGLNHIECNIDNFGFAPYTGPISFNTEGLHEIQYKAVDNLGTWSATSSFTVFALDTTIETTLIPTEVPYVANAINIHSINCKYSLLITRGEGWLDHIEYKVDSGNYTTYNAPFGITTGGPHTIEYYGVDKNGKHEAAHTYIFIIDIEPPQINNISDTPDPFTPNSELNIGIDDTTTLSFNLTDNIFTELYVTIGIYDQQDNLVRRLDDNSLRSSGWQEVTWNGKDDNNQFVPEGTYTYLVEVRDEVGNTSQAQGTVTVARFMSELHITTDEQDQTRPDINGNMIVWQDNRNGNHDIYLYDTQANYETSITNDPYNQTLPAISEGKIVWQDDRNSSGGVTNNDIYLYDLTYQLEVQITSDASDQITPDISGHYIVWADNRNGNYDIYLYDYWTGIENQITNDASDQINPAVDGYTIVWEDHRNGHADIYAYDILTGLESRITIDISDQMNPHIYEDRIVWQDNRSGNIDIYVYDSLLNSERSLTADSYDQINAKVFGDLVIYEDYSSGNNDPDIYLINLTGDIKIQISSSISREEHPSIYGHTIVWQDNRSGNWDIRYALLPLLGQQRDIVRVVLDTDDQREPAIFAHSLLFTNYTEGIGNIYYKDITTGLEIPLTSDYSTIQNYPDISGEKIIWQDNRHGNWDIYMYDLLTQAETRITYDLSDQMYPSISRYRIVYQDNRSGDNNIHLYEILSDQEVQITADTYEQIKPDIHGDKIVWTDNRNNNLDIYMYDMSTFMESQITSDIHDQTDAKIYNSIIVWEDYRNGQADIYIYNLETNIEEQITAHPANQTNPSIYAKMLVWEDDRSGTKDIYLYDLTSGRTTQITNTSYSEENPAIYRNIICWKSNIASSVIYYSILSSNIPADTTPPEIREVLVAPSLISPDNSPGINDATTIWFVLDDNLSTKLEITLKVYDPQNQLIKIVLDRKLPVGTNTVSWDGTDENNSFVQEGFYTIKINAIDDAQLSAPEIIQTVRVDNTSPIVSINHPVNNTIINTGLPSVAGTIADNGELDMDTFKLFINNTEVSGVSFTQTDFVYIPTSPLSEGMNTLLAQVSDRAGNMGTQSIQFTIDLTMPDIIITGVEEGVTYNPPVSPTVQVNDLHLETVIITLDNEPFISGASIVTSGGHNLQVYASDTAGNINQRTIQFSLSNQSPVGQLISPNGGEICSGTQDIIWTAEDINMDQLSIDLSWSIDGINWSDIATDLANTGTFSWDTTTVSDAETYRIKLSVDDGVNLVTDTSDSQFAIRNNLPPIAEAGPDQEIIFGNSVNLDGSASSDPDNYPQPLSFIWSFVSTPPGSSLADTDITNANASNATFTPDIAGTYVFNLEVNDGIASSSDTVTITVIEGGGQPLQISGGAYNFPENPIYRASFSMDVIGPPQNSGWLQYYYSRTRMNLMSTQITAVSVSGNTVIIEGIGSVNGMNGYSFIATVSDSTPDIFGITIYTSVGTIYYQAAAEQINGGDLIISGI